jgi:hypothetical protein
LAQVDLEVKGQILAVRAEAIDRMQSLVGGLQRVVGERNMARELELVDRTIDATRRH